MELLEQRLKSKKHETNLETRDSCGVGGIGGVPAVCGRDGVRVRLGRTLRAFADRTLANLGKIAFSGREIKS